MLNNTLSVSRVHLFWPARTYGRAPTPPRLGGPRSTFPSPPATKPGAVQQIHMRTHPYTSDAVSLVPRAVWCRRVLHLNSARPKRWTIAHPHTSDAIRTHPKMDVYHLPRTKMGVYQYAAGGTSQSYLPRTRPTLHLNSARGPSDAPVKLCAAPLQGAGRAAPQR